MISVQTNVCTKQIFLTVLVTRVMCCGRFPDRLNVITFMHHYYKVCRCDNLENFPIHISTKATALISDCGYRFILWLPFWPKMCGNFPYSAVITYVDSLELSTKNVVGLSSRERDLLCMIEAPQLQMLQRCGSRSADVPLREE